MDLGTGPGHDAVYLARKGFRVTAIDISPAAIALAMKTARQAKVSVEFKVKDILAYNPEKSSATFVNDRGCLHCLMPRDRSPYVELIHRVLVPEGYLLLRTFSDKEQPGPGPYRFSQQELESLFSRRFEFLEFKEGIFEGSAKPKAYLCFLQKRAKVPLRGVQRSDRPEGRKQATT